MGLYVGNLAYEVTEEEISSLFQDYGSVRCVQIPTNRETGCPEGFAFVDMATGAEETKALTALHGYTWMGQTLIVKQARPRLDGQSTQSTHQQPHHDRWGNLQYPQRPRP